MSHTDLEGLLRRSAVLPTDTDATPKDWHVLAAEIAQASAAMMAYSSRHALGDTLSQLASGMSTIAAALTDGYHHPATDLIEPLSVAILAMSLRADDVDAMEMIFSLLDDPCWLADYLPTASIATSTLPVPEVDELSGIADAAERALTGIDALELLLHASWDSEAVSGLLFVIAQDADEGQLPVLAEACFALAEKMALIADAVCQPLFTEHATLALLDAYSGAQESVTLLLNLLNAAQELPSLSDSTPETEDAFAADDTSDISEARQQVGRDMMAVLDEELEVVASEIEQTLSVLATLEHSPDGAARRADEQAALGEFFQRLAGACDAIGLVVLSEWVYTYAALMLSAMEGTQPDAGQRQAMQNMVPTMHSYCLAPDDQEAAMALAELLTLPCWSDPWAATEAHHLAMRLCAVDIVEVTAGAVMERATTATAEDVSLDIPADINPELLEGLIQELPVQTSAFSQAILHVATGNGTLNDLDIAKRAAHTLKGAANTVGIPGIANLTHHLEDVLIVLHKAERMPGRAAAQILIEAGDCLEAMSEAVQGIMPAPADRMKVLQRVLDLANQIDAYGIPDDDLPIATSSANDTVSLPDDVAVATPITTVPDTSASIRVPAGLIDDLLRLVNESIISAAQLREQLAQSRATTGRMRAQNAIFGHLVGELEHMVDIRGLGMGSQQPSVQSADSDFDELEFEEFNELQTLSRQLTEAALDARTIGQDGEVQLEHFSELVELHHRLQVQSQDLVMRTRMVPVATIEPRLQRSARQTSRLLDKEVGLDIEGANTLMDSHVLQALVDPLMHIIRNAIDHGLEMPTEREALGKPRVGQLTLSFNREGNSIVVRCRDDGQGLDQVAIRHKAELIGMITPEQELSAEEVMRLILRHGFSTRDEASQISGRGIGMDAVLAAIHDLKGTLFLNNEPGHGLMVELRLPVSLVASHALLVASGSQVYALSTGGIHDLLYLDAADVSVTQDGLMLARVNDRMLPLVDFEELLCVPKQKNDDRNGFPVVIVQLDTGALEAVRLQAVHDSRDIVVKDLGVYVPRMSGLLGATILGDGNVAPVIDLRDLATMAGSDGLQQWQRAHPQQEMFAAEQRKSALVVDDSLSARRHTAQFMRDAGFEVHEASDGLDAVTMMERWVPDIILTDMEMPRMNGLELASYIRSQTRLAGIPIIMISSRSTDKHRRQASHAGVTAYHVKPFSEDLLIENVINLTQAQVLIENGGVVV